MILPTDHKERKNIPVYSGVIKYFPRALAAVAKLSKQGNEQHDNGDELHWDRDKSPDELDAMMRHVIDEHWDAVAWRALAHLEKHLEKFDEDFIDQPRVRKIDEELPEDHVTFEPVPDREETWNVVDRSNRTIGIVHGETEVFAKAAWLTRKLKVR